MFWGKVIKLYKCIERYILGSNKYLDIKWCRYITVLTYIIFAVGSVMILANSWSFAMLQFILMLHFALFHMQFQRQNIYFSTVDCMDPSCSGRGSCLHGQCHCNSGWTGANCETQLSVCLEHCSGHGMFQSDTSTCICEVNWTGPDCSTGTTLIPLNITDIVLYGR